MRQRFVQPVLIALALWAMMILGTSARAACTDAVPGKRVRDTNAAAAVDVPYFFGLSRDRAQALANDACLTLRFTGPSSSDARVVTQSLPASANVRAKSLVLLRMAVVDSVTVPPLIGLSRDAASSRAESNGLKPLIYGPNGGDAVVVTQSRPAGQTVARGSFIQLQVSVSKAPARTTTVPDFVGHTRAQAEAMATAYHLDASFDGSTEAAAHVVSQSPAPGTQVAIGSSERLQLAVAQATVPNILHRTLAAARALVTRRGFVLDPTGDLGSESRVTRQSPAAGASLDSGAHIAAVLAIPAIMPATIEPANTQEGTNPTELGTEGQNTATPTMIELPDLLGKTRAQISELLTPLDVVPQFLGDTTSDALATSQSLPAGQSVKAGMIVKIVMVKTAASSKSWLIRIGSAIILAIAAFLFGPGLAKKLKKRDPAPPDIVSPATSPAKDPPVVPTPTVTFAPIVDQGRPTVRFKSEPSAAARALAPDAPKGGRS